MARGVAMANKIIVSSFLTTIKVPKRALVITVRGIHKRKALK
ncbi:Uncharacterised protein [Streptococcus pyogenes]|nr:Uncharacterised protein [Streptococcus pyogenes]VGT04788.1 Uncharacterised protein [Streptococcus pyogenes]VGV52241.1 Uncharacterised protein [Streptococcus pyogenes]